MEKRDKSKFNLWCLVIWNILIFTGILIVFIKLLLRKIDGNCESIQENIFLIILPIFFIVNIKPVINNIRKLVLSYTTTDWEKKDNPIIKEYQFLNMYRKVSNRRMFLVFIFPFISNACVLCCLPIFSNGRISWNRVFQLWYKIISSEYFLVLTAICLLLTVKIYVSKKHNLNLLFSIYDYAMEQEINDLNSIGERQAGYVFTEDFLINWDGNLNIVPLKEIKELKYISYFYLIIHGTRLSITCDKKYVIWHHGPSENEWIERGLLSPNQEEKKSIYMNIEIPM